MDSTRDRQADDPLALLLSRFGERRPLVEAEFRRSDEFRSLCEDYLLCANAMDKWRVSNASIAAQREREYAQWLAELEMEVREWLERAQTAGQGVQPAARENDL